MKCPCINCEERSSECHGKCQKYHEWSLKREKQKEKEYKARQKIILGIPYTLHRRPL